MSSVGHFHDGHSALKQREVERFLFRGPLVLKEVFRFSSSSTSSKLKTLF
jgi:hypothetical protein